MPRPQFLHNAELLADMLRNTRRRDLIVVSFNQRAVDRFHALVPAVPVAPGIDGIAGFLLGGSSPGAGVVALQIPITYELSGQTIEVTTPESVLSAHRAGYAVHVWLSNDEESAPGLRPPARHVRRRDHGRAAAGARAAAAGARRRPAGWAAAPIRARCGRGARRSPAARSRSASSGVARDRRRTGAR